ncbi:hypothetical protein L7F22_030135 [Adiantum nelumboides]|nr:hypothetical protein [Adiantum nelumboides]
MPKSRGGSHLILSDDTYLREGEKNVFLNGAPTANGVAPLFSINDNKNEKPRETFKESWNSGSLAQFVHPAENFLARIAAAVLGKDTGRGIVDGQVRMPDLVRGLYEKTAQHHPLHQLQAHDQLDDRDYDEFTEGLGQSGEGDSYGGVEGGGAALEAVVSSGSFRLGSRSSRPRLIVERKEREIKREGKWERKQL